MYFATHRSQSTLPVLGGLMSFTLQPLMLGSDPPTPRGSHATMSNRSRTLWGNIPWIQVMLETAAEPGPPGLKVMTPRRSPGFSALIRATEMR
jgi:hypothetical protein